MIRIINNRAVNDEKFMIILACKLIFLIIVRHNNYNYILIITVNSVKSYNVMFLNER